MARMERKSACLWHAFDALKDTPDSEVVKKAKLKVLTHNIANCLGLVRREERLDNYEEETMTYPSFVGFLRSEIFCNLRDNNNSSQALEKFDEVCWYLCCKKYMTRAPVVLDQDNMYILWKIFNTLAELTSEGMAAIPVIVDCEEVQLLATEFCKILGTAFKSKEFAEIAQEIPQFSFEQVLNYFETHLCQTQGQRLDVETTTKALKELQDSIIYEVIKKGMLIKKGNNMLTGFKERWFVLTPTAFKYFTNSDERDIKGEVPINPLCNVDSGDDGHKSSQSNARYPYKFRLCTPGRNYEICAPDVKTRGEWKTAIKTAIDYCKKAKTPQENAREDRRKERDERREKLRQDEIRRKQSLADIEKARRELEEQRRAREEAEARARQEEEKRRREEELVALARSQLDAERQERERIAAEIEAEKLRREEEKKRSEEKQQLLEQAKKDREEIEARLRDLVSGRQEDQRQLDELLSDRQKLEQLLEAETRAKRDEEIVRGLQAKALQEEYEKREMLERMREELESTLSQEKKKRVGLEETRQQQEEALRLEQTKLQLIEQEQHKLQQDLQDAKVKLEEAEQLKFEMEEKFKKKKPEILQRLAAHLPDNEKFEIVTHRGLGAFVEADFSRRDSERTPLSSPSYLTRDDDSGVPSDSSDSPQEVYKKQTEDGDVFQMTPEYQQDAIYDNTDIVSQGIEATSIRAEKSSSSDEEVQESDGTTEDRRTSEEVKQRSSFADDDKLTLVDNTT